MTFNTKVLISITTDIAYKNPRTYPIAVAIISKLLDFLSEDDKKEISCKIIKKFKKLPNTGIMQLWLQRITIKLDNSFFFSDRYENYSENLCKKVANDSNIAIWNSKWLSDELQSTISSHGLINQKVLDELGAIITKEEVEVFGDSEYPF